MFQDYEGSRLEFLKLLVEQGEEPAFLQRSRKTAEAIEQFHAQIREHRDRCLKESWTQLHALADKIGSDWRQLESYLAKPDDIRIYESLFDQWTASHQDISAGPPAFGLATVHSTLKRFHQAVGRFNLLWDKYLSNIDLGSINQVLADHNRYYPLEKACAFGSEDIERLGFIATQPLKRDDLRKRYPLLSLPNLR